REDFTEGAGYLGAVFTPIFFISLGLQVDLPAAVGSSELLLFGGVLTFIAIVTKVLGCGIPAWLSNMTRHEAASVGWGMTPRGEVGLSVALSALNAEGSRDTRFSVSPADVLDEDVRLRISRRLLQGAVAGSAVLSLPQEDTGFVDPHRQAGGERQAHRLRRDDLVRVAPVAELHQFGEDFVEDLGASQRDSVGDWMDKILVVPEADHRGVGEARAEPVERHLRASRRDSARPRRPSRGCPPRLAPGDLASGRRRRRSLCPRRSRGRSRPNCSGPRCEA